MRSFARMSHRLRLLSLLVWVTLPAMSLGLPPGSEAAPGLAAVADGAWQGIIREPLNRHAAIYDSLRGRMLVFGGSTAAGPTNAVWQLTLTGSPTWTQLAPTGTPPSARYGHTAVYDRLRDRLLVFGGYDGLYRNDVWSLSLTGTPAWTQLTPTGTPPMGRYQHSAIYDPVRDRMLIFGGYDGNLNRADVVELSLAGTPAWTQLNPTGTAPAGRSAHSAIYDPVRDRMLIFGGSSGTRYNDVRALKLAGALTWTLVSPAGTPPSARAAHGAIYDPVRDRMLVFGGDDGTNRNDTWELALASPTWTLLSPGGSPPAPRATHVAIYDALADRMVVHGGANDNIAYQLPLAGPAWASLGPGSTFPSPHSEHSAIYDAAGRRMVIFGGFTGLGTGLNETWAFALTDPPAWTQLQPLGTPPSARSGHTAIYDPLRRRMIMFGGGGLNELWELTLGGTPTWTPLSPVGAPPAGRYNHTAIYDPVRDRMIVFGGYSSGALADVWQLSLSGSPTWTQLSPAGPSPGGRSGHGAIYDPVRDRMLVFGGTTSSDFRNDVWALSLAGTPTWTQLTPSGTPPAARAYSSAIYDAHRDRMIVFGGFAYNMFGFKVFYNDTWSLSLAGPQWSQLAPTGPLPGFRRAQSAIYDRINDRMVMYGGEVGGLNIYAQGDLWGLQWDSPVVGPDIEVAPQAVDYGNVFVGTTPTRAVVISNYGTSDLTVSNVASSDGTLTPDATSFTLMPAESRSLSVQWAPVAPGALNATLTVSSNDPDAPSRVVTVSGSASVAPSFTADPESLHVTLDPNGSDTRTLRITNVGGSDYVFIAEAIDSIPPGPPAAARASAGAIGRGLRGSVPGPLRTGGPDAFGYTYRDSDEPNGPVFAWQDVRAMGTLIPISGDDDNAGPYPIGFDFPFYDGVFSTFRICTNGWISFTNAASTAYTNTSLPNAGAQVPENLLAVLWDDLDFAGVRHATYHSDGSRLVIQYQDVARVEEPGQPNTFEAILYPDGSIVYQYLSLTASTLNSNTVGIQNAARDDGLQVTFDGTYLHDQLAIRFRGPATQFLMVAPTGGTVPPQQHLDLTVTFDAAGLAPGEYRGVIRIDGNDPLHPRRDVPCRLTVTGPIAAPGPAAVDRFGLRLAGPNPAHVSACVELAVAERGEAEVSVFDLRGALVRSVARREFEPGRHLIRWDGTDAAGRRVPAGVYFVRATARGARRALRLAWVR